ncbi:hypothetical protein Trydic_g6600 [Trypoxylus dichotomus]
MIPTKRRERLTKGIMLLCDNDKTATWLQKCNCEVRVHPSSSSDLFPSDFYLFGSMEAHLSGKRFKDDDELQDEVRQDLKNLDRTFNEEGIQKLVSRWDKCLNIGGHYVEK